MKDRILNFLELEAKADEQKALATFDLLFDHPAGIGDHSTGDFYDNARAALDNLVDARDRINAIHFLRIDRQDSNRDPSKGVTPCGPQGRA